MSVNLTPEVPENCRAPNHPILRLAFKILCIIAVSQKSLDHWNDTKNKEWKEHVSVMVNRFQNSNITAGLVLATTTLFLSSVPPIEHLMAYNSSISYLFAMISFSAALLSVISGAAVLVIYETSTSNKDMESLKAGLVLATAALLLVSSPPVTSLMAFDTPASYVFAIIAFSAALLSVISGAAVVVIYETSTTHKDMKYLKVMPRHQIICLLLWLAYPSICLAVAVCFLFASLFIACFCSGNVPVQVITALGCSAFLINGILTLYVFNFVGKPPADSGMDSTSKVV
ncbi:uncharacterized protein BJ212DRAFT_1575834 [Suillus subaureus]|uniref:Uncharacterized protein n=1 Tax=Suillus subaureus TaxID=48587 RepID=A0A9P7EEN5_9AGAM|nr:uncharacterized protein BJ212DRAFT_1575834 [Suillus subaureus]KAG1819540.1 hypothetical protein BJ212DRAFT_1575834 [Suillus subaureus]